MSKKNKCETLIYCGPSFSGELQQFSVFKGGIPKYLDKHIEECVHIRRLFVTIDKLKDTREKLIKKGSREYQMYFNILEYQRRLSK